LVIVTVLAALVALVTPMTTLPNATLTGLIVSPVAAAGPALATIAQSSTNASAKNLSSDETGPV
jgi:hypothetical protein